MSAEARAFVRLNRPDLGLILLLRLWMLAFGLGPKAGLAAAVMPLMRAESCWSAVGRGRSCSPSGS